VAEAQFSEPALRADEPLLPPKMLAQFAWEAVHADSRELARLKVEAARLVSWARQKELLAGRGVLDFTLEASLNLLEAERAASGSEAEQLRAFERHWARTKTIEGVNQMRYERGPIPIQDYMQSKSERLRAETWLIEARAKSGKGANYEGTQADAVVVDPLDLGVVWNVRSIAQDADSPALGLGVKPLAESRFEVNGAKLEELAKAKLEAAQIIFQEREKEFLQGRGTLDFLLEAALRLLQEELAASNTELGRQAALESYCARAQLCVDINKERFHSARIPIQDLADTKYRLLEGEIWLAEARAKSRKPAIGGDVRAPQLSWRLDERPGEKPHVVGDPLESRDLARAQFEAMSTDPKALAHAKLDAARTTFEARLKDFLQGRGTLDYLLESSVRVIESELAQSDNQADRLAALERNWTQKKIGEIITRERFESGRIPIHHLARTVYERLKAEIRLLEAKK
jgi:hypothetical protein